MQLYSVVNSPFGRTVTIVADELGLTEDIEVVPTSVKPTAPNVEFQAVNPLRKIPALKTEDGLVIVDSPVIVEYLCARVGDTRMLGRGKPDEWLIRTQYAMARGAAEAAVAARYETFARPQEKQWDAWLADLLDKVGATLSIFEAAPPAGGGSLTVADISLAVLLGYLDFRFDDLNWRASYPALAEWLKPIEARPSFTATKPS
ncbi:glutathione S-transferase [Acuticoccus sediminis]|uniref:Glutathione S-transferase n=1 Tax=Acuticoccus sediminis TaxID=2184697 RepID=A0A8B2NKW9_9HYPH|nr:glutathione S-transferase family protein [Acuticoccus sediminis]RAI00255.1 glutathione S-transferase [Acuticoccus sediminis]